jgi:hypothetical protein
VHDERRVMSPLGIMLSIMAGALVGGLLLIAAWIGYRYIKMLEATRRKALVPYELLRAQDDAICAAIAETEGGLVSQELRDKMLACHLAYQKEIL